MADSVDFEFSRIGGGKVSVMAKNGTIRFADKVDPGSSVSRARFMKALREAMPAADHALLEQELLKIAAEPKQQQQAGADDPGAASEREIGKMPPEIVDRALAMLRSPDLLRQIMGDIRSTGVVGEFELALMLYLLGTSRLLAKPLAGIVQGSSSSGKSHCIERVASLFPQEATLLASDMTANALYYLPPGSLRHRFVVCGERSRNEDDQRAEATRALREMLSSGVLRKVLPTKDENGAIVTTVVESAGPIAFVESTTLGELFAEDKNRCLLLSSDDGAEQTARVLAAIGDFYATGHASDGEEARQRHHAAQRLLRRCHVRVPFGPKLAAATPVAKPEARRALHHVMNTISTVALLFQYQRCEQPEHGGTIVATLQDYAVARGLLLEPLARSIGGGVPGHVVAFHEWLVQTTAPTQAFTVADLKQRESCRWERSALYDMTKALRSNGALHDAGSVGRANLYRLAPNGLRSSVADWLPLPEDLA